MSWKDFILNTAEPRYVIWAPCAPSRSFPTMSKEAVEMMNEGTGWICMVVPPGHPDWNEDFLKNVEEVIENFKPFGGPASIFVFNKTDPTVHEVPLTGQLLTRKVLNRCISFLEFAQDTKAFEHMYINAIMTFQF